MNRTKIALITGASGGIGSEITKLFIKNGIEVITPGIEQMDLCVPDSIETYIKKLCRPVDILINCAGINPLDYIAELKDQNIDQLININLLAPIRLTKLLCQGMMERNYGRIVNISSIWSIVSKEKRSIYSVTKAGLDSFTRSSAVEFARYNILVNSIAPGFIETELTRKNNTEEQLNEIKKNIPLSRLAAPEEVAEAVYFFASEKNTFITGQTILADGGYSCL